MQVPADSIEAGRMSPAGAATFAARGPARSGIYSFERESAEFPPAFMKRFRASAEAGDFFMSQPPYYRKPATWWVVSAKKEETRNRRLSQLMDDSARARRLPQFIPDPASRRR